MSFDLISKQKPRAAEILSLMAVLDRQIIPESLLQNPSDQNVGFTKAQGTLLAFSLIKAGRDGAGYELHRTVQLATQNWLQMQDQIGMWQKKALSVVADKFPDAASFPNDEFPDAAWTIGKSLLPQAQTVIQYGEKLGVSSEKYSNFLSNVASFEMRHGQFEMSVKRRIATYEIRKNLLGKDHPSTLTSLSDMAYAFRLVKLWDKAEELLSTVIKDKERVLGAEHPDTLDSIRKLATIYEGKQRWKEAEKLIMQVLEISERAFGAEHPLTLDAMDDLAYVYGQGRVREAIVLSKRLVDLRTKINRAEHPQTLERMAELAMHYLLQGHRSEAVEMLERVVGLSTKIYGAEDSSTLEYKTDLVRIKINRGPIWWRVLDWDIERVFEGLILSAIKSGEETNVLSFEER